MGSHGLTLGKYAPLHRGHQHVIETALAECDQVTVIIYDCPETTPIPLPVRSGWIRRLYPEVRVLEAWNGPTAVGDEPAIREAHERYLLEELGISGITHFYSSEFYGGHVSRALGAVDRRIDPDRLVHPVSGSAIRRNAYAHRTWIDPLVYRDLVLNLAFLGGPSTGKSTMARHLAEALGTVWMPEHGRDYWFQHQQDHRLTEEELVELAEGHLEREETLLQEADRWLFTDTNALTTYVFSLYYHGRAHPRLAELTERCLERYDLVFLCAPDFPFEDTWDRSGPGSRLELQKRTEAELLRRKWPFVRLEGSMEERTATVLATLRQLHKWQNLGALLRAGSGAAPGEDTPCPIF